MKKEVFIILIFAILVQIAYASDTYVISHRCFKDMCIQGTDVTWTIYTYNRASDDILIDSFKIIDAVKGNTVAFAYYEKPLVIKPNEKSSVDIIKKLPKANDNLSFDYSFCVIRIPPTKDWGDVGKRIEYCFPEVYSIPVLQCFEDDECQVNEICDEKNQCTALECKFCQYPKEHKCNDYGCCMDTMCGRDQFCINNTCNNLNCNISEVIINHTCSFSACKGEEEVINDSCVSLECQYDEYIMYHRCNKLKCLFNETPFNHTCTPLICNTTQAMINNSCVELSCPEDYGPKNHKCQKLNCFFLTRSYGNFCGPFWTRIVQTQLFIIIVLLLFKDIRTYLYIKGKKTARQIYNQIQNKKINK